MSDTIIRVEHLSKEYKLYKSKSDRLKEALSLSGKQYYEPFYALNDISFEVNRGETIGIIGTNGSGKSTLLKILTGVVSPSSGTATVNGRISALLELGAGFNPEYTGLENIDLHGTMHGISEEEMKQRREEIIAFADIGEYINQPVKNYSSGMFARLAFAVAISIEPEILIVDEVLSVGDMRFQIKCMDRMKRMMENGTTILFVSHDISSVRRFCNRCVWIQNGRLRANGETNEVADLYVDYLKCSEYGIDKTELVRETESEDIPAFVPKQGENAIAEITHISLYQQGFSGKTDGKIKNQKPLTVKVVYDVYDETIEKPVLGVALFGIDDEYICGLNTLLDQVEIPWKFGRNQFCLTYPQGLCVLGGKYYFDAALFDQTATAAIHYCKYVKEITVESGYFAEGKLNIPHRWE